MDIHLKWIQGPLEELKGFGWKFVEKNKKILFGSRRSETSDISLDKGTVEI